MEQGNRLKALRTARGLTQEELARRANTTVGQIWKLEHGHRQLTEKWLRRLADALACQPAEIFDPASALSVNESALLAAYRELDDHHRGLLRDVVEAFMRHAPAGVEAGKISPFRPPPRSRPAAKADRRVAAK